MGSLDPVSLLVRVSPLVRVWTWTWTWIWIWVSVAAALVDPPVNVTLHCHNLTNILMWDYKQLTPGLRFRVDFRPYGRDLEQIFVEPPDLQAELPALTDPTIEFFVTVSAVVGEEESESGPSDDGITFSYFKDSPVNQKCVVDLPAVSVTTQPHNQVHFSFQHPWIIYEKKLRDGGKSKSKKRRSHDAQSSEPLPVFTYRVNVVSQGKSPHSYDCEERVCTSTLPVDASHNKHCLTISGEMKLMSVQSHQEYCAQPGDAPSYGYIYVIVSVLLLIPLVAVGFMFFRKKTRVTSPLPNLLRETTSVPRQPLGPFPEHVDISPEVLPASPTPLLTEDQDLNGFTAGPPDYDVRLRIGVDEDEGVSDVTEREEPAGEGSEYMEGRHMEVEEGRSAYESRSPVMDELSPGETVEGYRA